MTQEEQLGWWWVSKRNRQCWVVWLIGAWYCALNGILLPTTTLINTISTDDEICLQWLHLSMSAKIEGYFDMRIKRCHHLTCWLQQEAATCVESMNWARHSPRDSLMSDSHTQSHTSFFPCNHTNRAVVCLYPRCWEGETSDRISHSYAISTFNWINNVIKFGIKSIKDPWASWITTAVWPNLYYMGRDEH